MSEQELAQALDRFKKAGGDAFVDEPVPTLLSKFALYRLYEKEWPQLFKRVYTRQSPERLQHQIAVLRHADRSALCALPHEVTLAAIKAIAVPSTVLPKTWELTVNRRQTGHCVKEFATHLANVDDIHSGLKSLPAAGFLLLLADSGTVGSVLISEAGRNALSASAETIQNTMLPRVIEFNSTRRAEKIADLCAMLGYANVHMSKRIDAAFRAVGLIESEKDINEIVPKKAELREKLVQLVEGHRARCANLDRAKLAETDYEPTKVAFEVPEIASLSKIQIKAYITDIVAAKPILESNKLNLRGQQQTLIEQIQTLQAKRGALMDYLDSRAYYADHPHGAEASHISESLRNRTAHELLEYKTKLENYNTVLSAYQYDPATVRVKKPVLVGYY